jgi:hypothetical protein
VQLRPRLIFLYSQYQIKYFKGGAVESRFYNHSV